MRVMGIYRQWNIPVYKHLSFVSIRSALFSFAESKLFVFYTNKLVSEVENLH